MTSTSPVTTPAPEATPKAPNVPQSAPPPNSQNNRLPIADEDEEYRTVDLWVSDAQVIADRQAPVQNPPKDPAAAEQKWSFGEQM